MRFPRGISVDLGKKHVAEQGPKCGRNGAVSQKAMLQLSDTLLQLRSLSLPLEVEEIAPPMVPKPA